MPLEDGGACVVGEAPEADGTTLVSGGKGGTVGCEGERVDGTGVPLEDGGACTVRKAPEANGLIVAGGGEGGAVGRAGEGDDYTGVPLEDGGACVVGEAPEADGGVAAAGGEGGAVGRAGECVDGAGVPLSYGGACVVILFEQNTKRKVMKSRERSGNRNGEDPWPVTPSSAARRKLAAGAKFSAMRWANFENAMGLCRLAPNQISLQKLINAKSTT